MALLARYVYNQEVTGTTNVTAWGNIAGAGLDLSVASGFDNAQQEAFNTGNGVKNLVKSRDTSAGTKLETSTNLGIFTQGTIWIVGKQQVGTNQNDVGGIWFQGSEILIRRGTGDSIEARFGVNTPTYLSKSLSNNTIGIICFKFNGTSQSLQINNDTAATSSDVDELGMNTVLELMYQGNKSFAELRIYDTEMDGSTTTATYTELYNTYIGSSDTTTVLTFPSLPTKTVGDADFAPGATSNSPAAITYSSSNTSVATIVSGNIHIVGAGTSTITAMQGATSGYTDPADVTRLLTVNSNTMASVSNLPSGKLVSHAISTDDGTTWKTVVCSTGDIGVNGTQTAGAETSTRCGVHKAAGTSGWEITGSGAHNTSITAGTEVTANEMAALFQNNTTFRNRVQYDTDPTDYYREGSGFLSAYTETSAIDGFIGFDYTVAISGNLDLVS